MGKKALGILTVLVLLILGYVIFVQNKPKKVEDSQITKTLKMIFEIVWASGKIIEKI